MHPGSEMRVQAARELLSLEHRFQRSGISRAEEKRWLELAKQLFDQTGYRFRRRSWRLPCQARAMVVVAGELWPCELTEVSQTGLMLSGEALKDVEVGHEMTLASAHSGLRAVSLRLKCRVARLVPGARSEVGVEIVEGQEAHAEYFNAVYYPAYVRYLEQLSV